MSAVSRRKTAGGVWARSTPPESSTSIPYRESSAPTRRARSRSGVISAARLWSVSRDSRIRRAMTPASSRGVGQSIRATSTIATGSERNAIHASLVSAGRIAWLMSHARVGAVSGMSGAGQSSTSSRSISRRSSSRARLNCGWVSSSAAQLSASSDVSKSGKDHRAVWKTRDRRKQPGGRRDAARRSGGDHQVLGRARLPSFGSGHPEVDCGDAPGSTQPSRARISGH